MAHFLVRIGMGAYTGGEHVVPAAKEPDGNPEEGTEKIIQAVLVGKGDYGHAPGLQTMGDEGKVPFQFGAVQIGRDSQHENGIEGSHREIMVIGMAAKLVVPGHPALRQHAGTYIGGMEVYLREATDQCIVQIARTTANIQHVFSVQVQAIYCFVQALVEIVPVKRTLPGILVPVCTADPVEE